MKLGVGENTNDLGYGRGYGGGGDAGGEANAQIATEYLMFNLLSIGSSRGHQP